ncbi:DUF3667 domain-containing protein [Xanthomonas massiliensis]|uniref:DUF3667 domain-containing protein n=1 Tax=Xanthomonas massiliensis TaxID=1720302 RepID=UPI000824CA1B|nr:DUF3667 domain-containing protein [Xanthomonas massiliensis]
MADHPDACASCRNCGTPLQGEFCYHCGQSTHDPVRSVGHAVEEMFESFWHLDGRIFRTLRALLAPGRLALAYLSGHRVPFVAPMRLFVVLSVLTFFVARLALHVEYGASDEAAADHAAAADGGQASDRFSAARTPQQVQALRHSTVTELQHALDALPDGMGKAAGEASMKLAIARVNQRADARLAELGQADADADANTTATPSAASGTDAESAPGTGKDDSGAAVADTDTGAADVHVDFLPGFANRWLTGQIEHIKANLPRLHDNPQLLANAFLGAVPSALFVLVPLFAALLRLFYLGSGRLYLEHLVVALYSHAFLCLDLLVVLVLAMARAWIAPHAGWAAAGLGLVVAALVAWMPVYLLLMQKRVYDQRWRWTVPKYMVLGWLYAWLVTFAALWLAFTSLAHL